MDTFKLTVQKRDTSGKGPARRMRVAGQVPAVVYGKGLETVPLTLDLLDLRDALHHGQNVVLELHYGSAAGKKHYAVIKEMQRSPARNAILHVDLHEIDLKTEIEAAVAVELAGHGPGDPRWWRTRSPAPTRCTSGRCPPSVPDRLQFDVTELGIGDHVTDRRPGGPRRGHLPGRSWIGDRHDPGSARSYRRGAARG